MKLNPGIFVMKKIHQFCGTGFKLSCSRQLGCLRSNLEIRIRKRKSPCQAFIAL